MISIDNAEIMLKADNQIKNSSRGTNRACSFFGDVETVAPSWAPSIGSAMLEGSLEVEGRISKCAIKCKKARYKALWARCDATHIRDPMPKAN
jgi:hypothetical protein